MSRHNPRRAAPKNTSPVSELRIIGGEWRSRKLSFPEAEGLRPTPDRVRETLFNWLQAVTPAARCLDLFSGSGALSFEALSRGAAQATLIDASPQVVRSLKSNLQTLKAQNAEVHEADALGWLERQPADLSQRFDLVFLDPPFRQGLLKPIAELLESRNLLADDAYIYVEAERELGTPEVPSNWRLHREKAAGQVSYRLYNREQ
jgi:16S rRNA (guanine966-N2)-methyltransferase